MCMCMGERNPAYFWEVVDYFRSNNMHDILKHDFWVARSKYNIKRLQHSELTF